MKIDKATFLLLATAMAAGGCKVKEVDTDNNIGGSSGDGGGHTDHGGSDQGGGGSTGQGGGDTGGGGTCDDSVGSPADCGPLEEGVCSSYQFCNAATYYFKPAVAESIVDCVFDYEASECSENPYDCFENALGEACPDSTADADCEVYVATCGVTEDECHALVDGLNDYGRDAVYSCVESDACYYGLWSCVESISWL